MEHLTSELIAFVDRLGEKTTSNDTDSKRDNNESTATNWLQLLRKTNGKRKVVIASLAFHKTWAQVCRLLESLEEEYKRIEDCCCATGKPDSSGQMDLVTSMISEHLKRKEFFLKACTLTKGIADIFLRYEERNGATMGWLSNDQEEHVTGILNDLSDRENRVLNLWNRRKQQLDQCLQYLAFERRAIQAQESIREMGEVYLSTCNSTGSSICFRQELLKEKENLNIISKEMEECVKLLIRMADRYGAKGHSHAGKIKKCALAVEQCYRASSNNKMRDDDLELNSGTRKSARSKAFMLAERCYKKLTAKYSAARHSREEKRESNDTSHGDNMMRRSCRALKRGH